MKKTAVQWLQEQLIKKTMLPIEAIKQAKAMEKEQIKDAFEAAEKFCGRDILHGDLYYNETFKSE